MAKDRMDVLELLRKEAHNADIGRWTPDRIPIYDWKH